ncbi:MAG: hypothetical protein JSW50_14915 [Candidatus Latescibacterota bacterium]|nr:MAG: hypothetical protein JSW50_14915 [Candidatus Latescibacterota bacterium]
MSSQKVYIIDEPKQIAGRTTTSDRFSERATRAPNRRSSASSRIRNGKWPLALRAYALGPINLILWPAGSGRIAWAAAGAGSMLATAILWIWRDTTVDPLAPVAGSAVILVTLFAFVILSLATVWARAVATAEQACWPQLFRRSCIVFALGLVLPGMGLLIAGHRWKAAFAVWCAGLLVAAAFVINHWRWLAPQARDGQGSLTHQSIEWILIVAACCVACGILAWLALAFDGVRMVSSRAHTGSAANWLSLLLIATLVLFLATIRPSLIAAELASAGTRCQHHGMRMIPLALCEAASILDPATPHYLAKSAMLNDELGMSERAALKRGLLHERATQFAGAVGAKLVPVVADEPTIPWAEAPLIWSGHQPLHEIWWTRSTDAEHAPQTP